VIAGVLGIVAGLLLLLGLFTPLASMLLVVSEIGGAALGLGLGESGIHLPTAAAMCAVVVASALALLGPGAYSVDAKMFGRREILIK
jgi:uncharacterized membrane protein YphA (DoxX/SURF4 family)